MRLRSTQGRLLLVAVVLGTSMAFLDSTVVNVALPQIGRDLDAGVTGLQWTVNAYTLTLAALILLGGSLGDRYGRCRVFVAGVIWFAIASAACAAAPSIEVLVVSRAFQGIGAALLTPGSLAIISASIDPRDRGAAIGAWAGLAGVSTALGPLLGGWLVQAVSWRAVFLINIPIAAIVVLLALRYVPESRDSRVDGPIDAVGATLTAFGLALLTFGLVGQRSWACVAGVVVMVAFVLHQRRAIHPLVPVSLFADRVFTAANLTTLAAYAALSGAMFLLVLHLQYVVDYSPLEAGAASLPVTVLMLLFSSKAGEMGERIGPRIPMTIGPIVGATGLALLSRVDANADYLVDVFPGVVVFGIGLTMLVAPLTTAVLGAAPASQVGIASGVNNAVARTASLLAIAAIPPIVGISGGDFANPEVFAPGYRWGMIICAGLLVAAGAISVGLVRGRDPHADALR